MIFIKILLIFIIISCVVWLLIKRYNLSNSKLMVGDQEIQSNNIDKCLDCGCQITKYNDSGWEKFIDGVHTQKICKKCDETDTENNNKIIQERREEIAKIIFPRKLKEYSDKEIEQIIEKSNLRNNPNSTFFCNKPKGD